MSPCPSLKQLTSFLEGTLSPNDLDTVSEHVQRCLVCDARLSDLQQSSGSAVRQLSVSHSRQSHAIGSDDAAAGTVAVSDLPDALLGPYQLLHQIGQGGMGTVYKARHLKMDRFEAVKILPQSVMRQSQAVERFEREIRAVAKLDHPNIVRAYHAGEERDQHYLAMEFVDGIDVGALIQQHEQLKIADACEIVRQAAEGLQNAHEHGMVHRDIKPSNLILSRKGVVKILDLGLALVTGEAAHQAGNLTSSGQIMGTLDYMAPEQGGDAHDVDIRADLYSLGATLYHLVAGRAPFGGVKFTNVMQKLMTLANQPPRSIQEERPEVPDELAKVVHRLLAKAPLERYATPQDVARALIPFTEGHQLGTLAAVPRTSQSMEASHASTFHYSASAQVKTDVDARLSPQAEPPATASPTPTGGVMHHPPGQRPPRGPAQVGQSPRAEDGSKRMQRLRYALVPFAGAILLFGIWIVIKGQDGKEKARYKVDDTDRIEIQPGDVTSKPPSSPAVDQAHRPPKTVPANVPSAPADSTEFVSAPTPIPGVKKWTIQTRAPLESAFQPPIHPSYATLRWSKDGLTPVGAGGYESYIGGIPYDDAIWSPDGRRMARLSTTDGTAKGATIWFTDDGQSIRLPFNCHDLAFSPDGRKGILSAMQTDTRRFVYQVWDVDQNQQAFPLNLELDQDQWSYAVGVAWSPTADVIAAAVTTDTVQFWNAKTGEKLYQWKPRNRPVCMAYSPDGRRLAMQSAYDYEVWDVESGSRMVTLPFRAFPGTFRLGMAWLPGGKELALHCIDHQMRIVNLENKNSIREFSVGKTMGEEAGAFNRIGTLYVAPRASGHLDIYSTLTGRYLYKLLYLKDTRLIPSETPQWMKISPEGHIIGSDGVEELINYVVETADGTKTLTPAEFADQYGWKNDPEKVTTTP